MEVVHLKIFRASNFSAFTEVCPSLYESTMSSKVAAAGGGGDKGEEGPRARLAVRKAATTCYIPRMVSVSAWLGLGVPRYLNKQYSGCVCEGAFA